MKTALIATVYNEADNLARWWGCLQKQTVAPDEIVIVDGGSKDGTWEMLQALAQQSSAPVKLEQRRCNIAEGRNRAIQLTDAEIIATTDAGSFPDPEWFGAITRRFKGNKTPGMVGGRNMNLPGNDFQKMVELMDGKYREPTDGEAHGSGRNSAYTRATWAGVGGYPEWLTLTGEDILFNLQVCKTGEKIVYVPEAVVHWPMRENAGAYFKMLYHYGYGAGEAGLCASYFLRRAAIMVFPPLLFLSRHRFRLLKFRYRKNAASALGWLAGRWKGRRPPAGWKRLDGIFMSPEAQNCLEKKSSRV